jgi:hypothetical protein
MIVVTAEKKTAASAVGIRLWQSPYGAQQIVVVYIDNQNSIFTQSKLKVGMRIDSINGVDCSDKTVRYAMSLLEGTPVGGVVSVAVSTPQPTFVLAPSSCEEAKQQPCSCIQAETMGGGVQSGPFMVESDCSSEAGPCNEEEDEEDASATTKTTRRESRGSATASTAKHPESTKFLSAVRKVGLCAVLSVLSFLAIQFR